MRIRRRAERRTRRLGTLARRLAVVVAVSLAAIGLTPAVAEAAFVDCSTHPWSVRVNVPYYPYAHCFEGSWTEVYINQPYSLQSNAHWPCFDWIWNGSGYHTCLNDFQTWYAPSSNVVIVYMQPY